MGWLNQNKEWLFSGIGVSALIGILGLISVSNKNAEGGKKNINLADVLLISFLIILFLTNPTKVEHINYLKEDFPILESEYKTRYVDNWFFSIAYTNDPLCKRLGQGKLYLKHCANESNEMKIFSYGILGKIIPTSNFRYLSE